MKMFLEVHELLRPGGYDEDKKHIYENLRWEHAKRYCTAMEIHYVILYYTEIRCTISS
jgi:hypothetical protein